MNHLGFIYYLEILKVMEEKTPLKIMGCATFRGNYCRYHYFLRTPVITTKPLDKLINSVKVLKIRVYCHPVVSFSTLFLPSNKCLIVNDTRTNSFDLFTTSPPGILTQVAVFDMPCINLYLASSR
jgi:hypothetical protein